MTHIHGAQRLALFGALAATFDAMHPVADQWLQTSQDAALKGSYGTELVYVDGVPVDQEDRPGVAMTATRCGQYAAARHVASYTAAQTAAAVAVTRLLGVRVPAGALAAGTVINAVTHYVLDRRRPLQQLAARAGKTSYIEYATVVRRPGGDAEVSGPGTALMELDQAAHRGIGVAAAAVTAWLATRTTRTRRGTV